MMFFGMYSSSNLLLLVSADTAIARRVGQVRNVEWVKGRHPLVFGLIRRVERSEEGDECEPKSEPSFIKACTILEIVKAACNMMQVVSWGCVHRNFMQLHNTSYNSSRFNVSDFPCEFLLTCTVAFT
jgi:hypothetical protein